MHSFENKGAKMERRELVYLDNAATSFPKPYAVSDAVKKYMLYCGGNAGRGGYESAMEASRLVYLCRQKLASFFDASSECVVFFTMNTTQGINACIKGLLKKGDHVLISNIEHNAVYRPIYKLLSRGHISCDLFSILDGERMLDIDEILNDIAKKVCKNTKMLICTAASNICSVRPPLKEIGAFCKERGIYFIVDGAQGAGHFKISIKDMNIDALCVPAHKGLLGPQGCGAVILGDDIKMQTVIEGGNGVDSLLGEMPDEPPERYEAGTLPLPAIAGFCEGISAVEQIGLEKISTHERTLFCQARDELAGIQGVKIFCPSHEGSVLLFTVKNADSERVCEYLSKSGICVRGGYHCAALAHKTLGTIDVGAIRASFGVFNNIGDIEALAEALKGWKHK